MQAIQTKPVCTKPLCTVVETLPHELRVNVLKFLTNRYECKYNAKTGWEVKVTLQVMQDYCGRHFYKPFFHAAVPSLQAENRQIILILEDLQEGRSAYGAPNFRKRSWNEIWAKELELIRLLEETKRVRKVILNDTTHCMVDDDDDFEETYAMQ